MATVAQSELSETAMQRLREANGQAVMITDGNRQIGALVELREVAMRSKFDPYQSLTKRMNFVDRFTDGAELVDVVHLIQDCIDPRIASTPRTISF